MVIQQTSIIRFARRCAAFFPARAAIAPGKEIDKHKDNEVTLARDCSGGIAISFALLVPIIIGICSLAIEGADIAAQRSWLQKHADAASLAAAMSSVEPDSNPEGIATSFIRGMSMKRIKQLSVSYQQSDEIHTVILYAEREPLFWIPFGPSNITVMSSATAQREYRPADIGIVVDTTNSMIPSWATSVQTIGNILRDLQSKDRSSIRVSLVPFADRVRLPSAIAQTIAFDSPSGWNHCLEPMPMESGYLVEYPHALDVLRTSGFVPSVAKNLPELHVGLTYGENSLPFCPNTPMVPLTNDIEKIENSMLAMRAGGTGRFDEGLAWGARSVLEQWESVWGASSSAPTQDKERIIVFITDGMATVYDFEVLNSSPRIRVGNSYQASDSYGWNRGSRTGFNHLVELCKRLQDKGIRILLIQIAGNSHFDKYAQSCANQGDYYKASGPIQITNAFRQIGRHLVNRHARIVQ